jgi:Periplasmic protease
MNFKIIFLTLTFITLIPKVTYGQDCNCESNFEWVKKTFEENDAGFQYILEKKGQQAYDVHNALFVDKIKSAKNLTECTTLLREWFAFFRSGHIDIEPLVNFDFSNNSTNETKTDYETIDIDITEFEKYVGQKKEIDFEGVWELDLYKIGIKKVGNDYVGFIIASGVETWKEGQVKLRIIKDNDTFSSIYHMGNHTPLETSSPKLIGNNHLQIGGWLLKRILPSFPDEKEVQGYVKSLSTNEPYLEELNSTTLLLRIPSFDQSKKTIIDNVILNNKDKILKTENLIIDLRNNGGGDDICFSELIPFLYTNPIRTIGLEYLSTKLNNQRALDYATNPEYGFNENTRKSAMDSYNILEEHLNEFISLGFAEVSIRNQDTIYTYPQNIGILINDGCASTTEQFLLAAKQSKKVKLFGTATYGALDISNLYSVESPCKELRLSYCLSRSRRIPDMAIDDIGIQPDFFIDKSIPDYKWVDFAVEILNQK